ncbi:hypothetical protein SAMN04489760_105158 [Syntrophus gentianae]|uniref:Uncharacterized protein n=1 Tax=Syntrophus gentianae TaxID=43775 RepID=A0A1H7W3K9_9BACT|nr:hypothetical protein [Syntrophus gentianae]SEM16172.1 hypothetical protein SAMN04489760_105158 [Syntrophus gentianae]
MESFDDLQIRCPRLGHEVPFAYCRREAGELPCFRVLLCWQSRIPAEDILRKTLSPEAWERFCRQESKDKVSSLIALIEAAKKRGKEKR